MRTAPTGIPNDADCVRRACGGDAAAFEALIERYQRQAVSIAYRLLGNLHDALEVCQEAFVRALLNIRTLEDPRRFRPWFFRIVTNLALNFRRARGGGPSRVSLEDCILNPEAPQEHLLAAGARRAAQPAAELAAAELAEAVQRALAELTEAQRVALVLFSLEQIPQREVASIMGCSVEAVKWHVFQARARLKRLLAPFLMER